jgi:hypothetical protein
MTCIVLLDGLDKKFIHERGAVFFSDARLAWLDFELHAFELSGIDDLLQLTGSLVVDPLFASLGADCGAHVANLRTTTTPLQSRR